MPMSYIARTEIDGQVHKMDMWKQRKAARYVKCRRPWERGRT